MNKKNAMKNGFDSDCYQIRSGDVKIAIEHGPLIVEFPIKNGDLPYLCVIVELPIKNSDLP